MIRSIIITLAIMMFSGAARADCFLEAARYQQVSPIALRGIAMVESSMNPKAMNRNKNGSIDYGLMQVNSIHLPELKRYKIRRHDLMNTCKNIYVAAWLLRRSMNKYGNTWRAIGGYHSNTPGEREEYAEKVKKAVIVIVTARKPAPRPVLTAAKPVPKYIATMMASN